MNNKDLTYINRMPNGEQPHIPIGFLKLRIPFVHYRITPSETIIAIICTFIYFAVVPVLIDIYGMTAAQAYTVVVICMFFHLLHPLFGDPVAPAWVTATLPLVIAFSLRYPLGTERVHALISVQLWFALISIFLGMTGIAKQIVTRLPATLRAGIVLGAGIAAFLDVFVRPKPWNISNLPITGWVVLVGALFLVWSYTMIRASKTSKLIKTISQFGLAIAYAGGVLFATIIGEIPMPIIEAGITPTDFSGLINGFTIIGLGLPPISIFFAALPLSFLIYVTAYGDIVFIDQLSIVAGKARPDEVIGSNQNRIHFIMGIRNILGTLFAPSPFMGGYWTSMTAVLTDRYMKGRQTMNSIFDGYGTYTVVMCIAVFIGPLWSVFSKGFAVALMIALIMQGFVCAYMGMSMVKYVQQKGVAMVIGFVLATKGAEYAIPLGLILYFVMEYRSRKEEKMPEPEIIILNTPEAETKEEIA